MPKRLSLIMLPVGGLDISDGVGDGEDSFGES